jgi:hypothetical protein
LELQASAVCNKNGIYVFGIPTSEIAIFNQPMLELEHKQAWILIEK